MSDKIIEKGAVIDFLDELIGTGQVFAPVLRDEILCLEPVESADEIAL
jgi:hypothetical protein